MGAESSMELLARAARLGAHRTYLRPRAVELGQKCLSTGRRPPASYWWINLRALGQCR